MSHYIYTLANMLYINILVSMKPNAYNIFTTIFPFLLGGEELYFDFFNYKLSK